MFAALTGAGLSAALTALRLGRTARVVLVDRKPDPRAAHTWSFHAGDIPADAQAWLLEEAKKGRQIQRFKGLGEMAPTQLRETTMDPSVRVLKQVSLDDAAAADELFSILMGEDVVARRSFIARNAKDVRFLDV